MYAKTLICIILVLLLSGCATTRKGHDIQIQQLKDRISTLEVELQKRDRQRYGQKDEGKDTRQRSMPSPKEKTKTQKLSITQIQTALRNSGFYRGPIDGKIGPATTEATRLFQKVNGLKVDGIVGNKTTAKMIKYLTD